jgi:GNAT superfamily N-acetyltransferase
MEIRPVTEDDISTVAVMLAGAFYHDPVWSWAFPDPELRLRQNFVWWALNLAIALRSRWVWTIDEGAAATLWIPPGASGITPEDAAQIVSLLRTMVGDRANVILDGLSLSHGATPSSEPHYYLSLWGSHPARRGEGIGTRLLVDNLARIDAEHMPCYLESSNPVNLERYARLGFHRHGELTMPAGGPVVTTMWRPSR